MRPEIVRWVIVLAAAVVTLVGCDRSAPTVSRSPIDSVRVEVRTAGLLFCNAFPYGCTGTLSVLEPDAVVDFLEPPPGGVGWIPRPVNGESSADDALVGVVPAVAVGRHQLVVTVLGSYDVASFGPDGKRALDLVSRCSKTIEIASGTGATTVVLTFDSDGTSYRASCSIDVTST